jgi:molybdate transport system regulatory protein
MTRPNTRLSIRIDLANGDNLGSEEIALLEAIQSRGSITGAARSLGISYRCAWLRVDHINKVLCSLTVRSAAGRFKGGGATLTPTGARFVKLYRAIEVRAQSATVAQCNALSRLARSERMRDAAAQGIIK